MLHAFALRPADRRLRLRRGALLTGVLAASAVFFCAPEVSAQAPPDTLRLGEVRAAAARHDPRSVQAELLARASRLRLASLRAEAFPQPALTGQATAQSDAVALPVRLPDGSTPSAPRVQGRVQAEADWNVFDGGRRGLRADVERARLAEETAGLAAALYPLREAATEAYFAALLFDAQAQTLALSATDLDARLVLARARSAEGAALATDADALEAETLRLRQRIDEAEASGRAARDVLASLTGRAVPPTAVLALPTFDADLDAALTEALPGTSGEGGSAGRPEVLRAVRAEARAAAEARLARAAARPSVSLFGQAGVARPSPFDFLSDAVRPFALVGVRMRWVPLDYGTAARTEALARLQGEAARADAEALRRRFRRDGLDEAAALARLARAAATDARVTALREGILRVARHRLDEGVALVPEYVDALTDVQEARLVAARHRIERAQAQARLLSALGRFPGDAP